MGFGGAPAGGALPSHSADVQAQLAQLQRAVETLAEQQAASHPCLLTMLVICAVRSNRAADRSPAHCFTPPWQATFRQQMLTFQQQVLAHISNGRCV